MKTVSLNTSKHRYSDCHNVKASEMGLKIQEMDQEKHFHPGRLHGRTDFERWNDGQDFRKQFPEGVCRLPLRCRFKDRLTGKYTYGTVEDVFIWTVPGPECMTVFNNFYSFVVGHGSCGWLADVAAEDMEFLMEGVYPPLKRGDHGCVWRNQASRDARVLNTFEDLALIEYEMPSGRVFRNVVHRYNKNLIRPGKVPFGLTSYELYLHEEHENLEEFEKALAPEAREVLNKILRLSDSGWLNYEDLKRLNRKAKKHGMNFDWGLDAEPYDFRVTVKISV